MSRRKPNKVRMSRVQGIAEAIEAIETGKAESAHSHVIADVASLQTSLDAKAPLASPTFTGNPAGPTPSGGDNSTKFATTAFVATAIANLINSAPGALDTLDELAAALGDDSNFASTITTAIAGKQPLDSDLTAIAALTTTPFGRSLLEAANAAALRTLAELGSFATVTPTGTPDGTKFLRDDLSWQSGGAGGGVDTANSPNANEFARFTDPNTIEGRTVSEAKTDLSLENVTNESKATMFTNPAFTGIPTAPTPSGGTNTTQVATTAFVQNELASAVAGLLDLKGDTDASTNPNYPAASKGDAYYVSVAGKIGGASGKSVDVSDLFVAKADNAGGTEAAVGSSWFVLEHNLVGALVSANNLSDLSNPATARSNLSLGALATLATVGTSQIDNDAVTLAKLQNIAANRILGNNTGGAADASELTATQVTAMLDAFTSVLKGLVPASGGGTSNFLRADGSWAAPSGGSAALPAGHIFGLILSNSPGDTANDITIAAGKARDEDDTEDIVLSAAITKRLDAAWTVGDNQGGLNTGAEANSTWYEVILIKRTDTGVVDVMFSTTANRATLPANYTKKRRIGWIRNDAGGSILQFTQVDDHFTLATQINDVAATLTSTAAQVTVTVPPNCIGRFRMGMTAGSGGTNLNDQTVVFSEIAEGNVTPTVTTGISSLSAAETASAVVTTAAGHMELRVNSSSQIEHDSSTNGNSGGGTFDISTFGWIDTRKRLSN